MSDRSQYILTPDLLLRAYAKGIFPMAEHATSTELLWFDPPIRALIPLDDTFHIPKRLRRTLRQKPYRVTLNACFTDVMRQCAAPAEGRESTWINREIINLYTTLHWRKHAHSIEVWDNLELVGGLYGVSLGSAFFGESMFSTKTNASKIALVYLVTLLRHCGFTLLDTQFQTEHLSQFGTYEITRVNYHHLLHIALQSPAELKALPSEEWNYLAGAAGALQPVTQTS